MQNPPKSAISKSTVRLGRIKGLLCKSIHQNTCLYWNIHDQRVYSLMSYISSYHSRYCWQNCTNIELPTTLQRTCINPYHYQSIHFNGSYLLLLTAFPLLKSESSSINFLSSLLNFFGISTCTRTNWSPLIFLLFRRGTPFFDITSVVFGCVPAGIFKSTMPSTVGTLMVVPKMASM